MLLAKEAALFPEQSALLASQGITQVKVFTRPRVTLMTTGTEVRLFRETVQDFEIRDSHQVVLKEAVKLSGAQLIAAGHLPYDFDQTVAALDKAAEASDVVLLAGGVSVGPHDHVKKAATTNGFLEIFWKISQQPGTSFFLPERKMCCSLACLASRFRLTWILCTIFFRPCAICRVLVLSGQWLKLCLQRVLKLWKNVRS